MPSKLQSFFKNYFRFETGYFTLGGWRKNLAYFIKLGSLPDHLVDRIKFRIYPKLMITPNFPSHLDVEVASACQMRCPMCYTTHMAESLKGVMKWELYTKIIDEAAKRRVYSIKLSWRGEPLLNKRLPEMVRYAKDKGIKEVAFLTNGELLTPEITEKLVDADLDWISFSADGSGAVYNELRAPAIFEETIEKVRYMKEYRDKQGKTRPLIRVQSLMSAAEKDPETFKSAWTPITDRINIIADQIRDFEVRYDLEYDTNFVCAKPFHRINIAYDGRVHQCGSDYGAMMITGDCNTHSLHEIWHNDANKRIRDAFRKHTYLDDLPVCRTCSYGLVAEKDKTAVGGGMTIRRYKGVPKVVTDTGVALKTPLEKMLTRHRNALKRLYSGAGREEQEK